MVYSIKNQYAGINAHLHSFLQGQGGWAAFHGTHLGDLHKTLKAALLPMGYTTDLEPSIQIRRLDDTWSYLEADVAIFDLNRTPRTPSLQSAWANELTLPIAELVAELPLSEKTYGAISIYELIPENHQHGALVAWLELLSPSNKVAGEDAKLYREKRRKLLQTGIVFIELDYLHETPPTFPHLPNYRRQEPHAQPYRMVILDPRPDLDQGQGLIREFGIDEPFPTVPIPLNGSDILVFDFGLPYQKTFEETLYGLEMVDYRDLPLNFKRYTPSDQQVILNRMLVTLETALSNQTLEQVLPLPKPLLPIEQALAQLRRLGARV